MSKLNNIKKKDIKKSINIDNQDIFDKYYGEIKELILTRWYENPLYTNNSYLIKVYITIDNKGHFNYNIIKYSGKIEIDNLLGRFLDKQKDIIYPISKDNKTKTILINFMNEEG